MVDYAKLSKDDQRLLKQFLEGSEDLWKRGCGYEAIREFLSSRELAGDLAELVKWIDHEYLAKSRCRGAESLFQVACVILISGVAILIWGNTLFGVIVSVVGGGWATLLRDDIRTQRHNIEACKSMRDQDLPS